jgi:hypothetical protein
MKITEKSFRRIHIAFVCYLIIVAGSMVFDMLWFGRPGHHIGALAFHSYKAGKLVFIFFGAAFLYGTLAYHADKQIKRTRELIKMIAKRDDLWKELMSERQGK